VIYPNVGDVQSENLQPLEDSLRADLLGYVGYPLIKDLAFELDYPSRELRVFGLMPSGATIVHAFAPADSIGVMHFTTPHENVPEVSVTVAGAQIPADFETGNQGTLTLTDATRHALEAAGALHVAKDTVTLDHATADGLALKIPLATVATGSANHMTI